MGYDIQAWLDCDGRPRLRIIDIDSGNVQMEWDCKGERSRAIKSLFHELILLSVRADVQRIQRTERRR